MYDRSYQPLEVLDIMPLIDGFFQVRTAVGWATLTDYDYQRMVNDGRHFIKSTQYGEGGAGLSIRFEFSAEQIELIGQLI